MRQAEVAAGVARRQYEEHQQGYPVLEEELREADAEVRSAIGPVTRTRGDVEQAEMRLANLSNAGRDSNGFHERMPTLLRALEQNRRLFRRFPVGPVGLHVSLLKPKWWAAVETALGNALGSFIVTSKADMEVLSDIMQKVNW